MPKIKQREKVTAPAYAEMYPVHGYNTSERKYLIMKNKLSTGEIAESWRIAWADLRSYHFLNLRWKEVSDNV